MKGDPDTTARQEIKLNRPRLALLRCKSKFEIFELGLIAVQIEIRHFRAWPYSRANRLGLIDEHNCTLFYNYRGSYL